MNIVYPPVEILADWVAARTPGIGGFGPCSGIGVEHQGELVAGVIYNNWHPEGGVIEMSAAATDRRWMTRPVIARIFGYPFDELKCGVMTAKTRIENEHIRRIGGVIGAVEHRIPDMWGLGKTGAFFVLTEPAWRASRFNGGSHGRKSAQAA